MDHRSRYADRAAEPPSPLSGRRAAPPPLGAHPAYPRDETDLNGYPGYAPMQGYAPLPVGRTQKALRLVGAAGSFLLVAGLIWWGWDLAMRDIRGVPVVRALEGPMRIAPEDPGGAIVDHQGLAVNDVAAGGGVAAPPDHLLLAPAPVELTDEDEAGLVLELPASALAAAEPEAAPDDSGLAEPPAPQVVANAPTDLDPDDLVPVIEGGQEDAVAAALAMALGEGGDEGLDGTDPVFETATLDDAGNPPPPGAVTRSPRPPPRPGAAAAPMTTTAAAPPVAIDPASLPAGTRLVQFGAYDSAEQAEAAWAQIAGRFSDLMAGKGMVIQTAESGGRNFFRLRATGFETELDSRRFCAALEAENVKCIPVAHR